MTKKEQRRQEWAARIANYETSGQTMKAWCDAQGVTKDTLRYWLRTLKPRPVRAAKAAAPGRDFIPLALSEPAGAAASGDASLLLQVGVVRVEVRHGFDPKLLREVVAALASPC